MRNFGGSKMVDGTQRERERVMEEGTRFHWRSRVTAAIVLMITLLLLLLLMIMILMTCSSADQ